MEPASPEFTVTIDAAPADIDGLGHVSNIVWIRYVQDAATAHSRAVGWDWDAYRTAGGVFVVRRQEVDYLGPAFEGDKLLATTFIASWGAATSVRKTRIARAGDGRELVRAVTTWAFVTIPAGRPRRVPEQLKADFARPIVAGLG